MLRRVIRGFLVAVLASAVIGGAAVATAADSARRIVANPGRDSFPRWSPDGTRIAFIADGSNTRGLPSVVGADGQGQIALEVEAASPPVSWSPDGRWVAYAISNFFDSPYSGVWIARADGSEKRRLVAGYGRFQAEFSPDGTRVVYTYSNPFASGEETIHVVRVDGSGDLTVAGPWARNPRWSPDGSRLVFGQYTVAGGSQSMRLFLVNADGTGLRRLTSTEAEEDAPDWSPDGRAITFHRPGFGNALDIWVINADGTQPRRILADAINPDWSPDGKRIVATSNCNDDACLADVNPNGAGKRKLTEMPDNAPAWSPDSRRLAFQRDISGSGTSDDIYVLDVPAYTPSTAKRCVAPRLRGKTFAAAKKALIRANCRLGRVRRARSSRARKGRVLSQKPRPGTRLASRARVSIVVGR